MFNDRTEIRNDKKDKKLWKAAAAAVGIDLSDWMRVRLTENAYTDLRGLPHKK